VSTPGQTLFRSETYFAEARRLPPGGILVSHIAGFYVSREEAAAGRRFEGVIRLASPLHDGRGAFAGALVLALDARHVEELSAHVVPGASARVAQADWSSGSYAYVIDDRGAAIAHPDDSVQWGVEADGRALPFASRKEEIGRLPVLLQHLAVADANLASIPARAATGRPGSLQYEWAGKRKVVAYAPIPYFGGAYRPPLGFGWVGIAAEMARFHESAAALNADVQRRVGTLTVASMFILLVAGLVVAFTGHAVAQGLRRAWAEARRAEEALTASERQFRDLVGRALIGIYRTTHAGQIVEANPALLHMLGARSVEQINAVGLIGLYAPPRSASGCWPRSRPGRCRASRRTSGASTPASSPSASPRTSCATRTARRASSRARSRTSRSAGARRSSCAKPRTRQRRRTGPRASSWPT
jgi:PAS domain-containing protein